MSNPIVTITLENNEIMTGELYPDKAPNTVNNFICLANSGYYADEAAAQGGMSGMTRLFIMADAAAVVLALGIEALVVLRWMKKRRESASK